MDNQLEATEANRDFYCFLLLRSTYNTTAPMYGVSLTSGQPVTIVQKFPDLLQQVIYETCE